VLKNAPSQEHFFGAKRGKMKVFLSFKTALDILLMEKQHLL
jgi:hypothetical protein